MYNPGPDYLSVGNRPLPPLFMVASVIYLGLLAVWIMHIRKHPTKVRVGTACASLGYGFSQPWSLADARRHTTCTT